MLGINNFAYFGFTQIFVPTIAAAFWGRSTKQGVIAGLIVGLAVIFILVGGNINLFDLNLNKGLIALICNFTVMVVVTLMTQTDEVTKKNYETFQNYNPVVHG